MREVHLLGESWYGVEVVGESFYQAALWELVGGQPRIREEQDGYRVFTMAQLVADPKNAFDANAIKVMIAGRHVGHLSREDAKKYKPMVEVLGDHGCVAVCKARIKGGFVKQPTGIVARLLGRRERASLGVTLDLKGPKQSLPKGWDKQPTAAVQNSEEADVHP